VVEVKGLVVVITPAILLAGVVSTGFGDAHISVADTSSPNNEVASSASGNSSASATITITMYTGDE
jgi:hypothetical protein